MVGMTDPVGVDSVQAQLDAEAKLAAKMVKVGSFVLPSALSAKFRIADQQPENLSSLNARFTALRQKTIAYKFANGWKTGRVWKKGSGERYGGLLWVFVREKRKPWRAHVRSCRVWD